MRHDNETLSDNTWIRRCEQCKTCAMWGNGNDPFSNKYDKTSCDMFPYPDMKPVGVRDNKEDCPYYQRRPG